MTSPITAAGANRIDTFFASLVGFCADFCVGARQGGYPPSPQPS